MNGAMQRFQRYPKAVLAAYLAQLAERPGGPSVAADLKALAEYYAKLRTLYPGARYELGDEAPECGVGKTREERHERTSA